MSERAGSERPDLWKAIYALPDSDTPLLGRESELASLQEAIDRGARLVTITGPAGIGKTRLAIELARRNAAESGPNAFLRLAPLRDAAMLAKLLASVCALDGWPDLPIDRFPPHLDGVLVLDGFDHVHDAGSTITSVQERCSKLKVIVTSRDAVHMPGETEFQLGPIDSDAARALLEAYRQGPRERPEGFKCLLAGAHGNPLALELLGSATWPDVPDHSELPDDVPPQLTAAVTSAIDALPLDAQRLFERLCMSAGAFEASLVASLAECQARIDGDIASFVAAMTRARLIRTHESGVIAARFEIPTAIREVGLTRLNASGDLAGVRVAYATHMFQRATTVRDLLAGARRSAALVWFEREYDGLRMAFGTFVQLNRVQQARAMAVTLLPYWLLRRRYREARRWLTVSLELTGAPFSDEIEQELLVALGLIELLSGSPSAARTRSLAGARPGMPGSQIGWRGAALATLGMLAAREGDFERGIGLYRVYLEATRSAPKDASWTPQLRTLTRLAMSVACLAQGDLDEAEYYATMAFKRGLALGDPLLVGYARINLGAVALAKQDLNAALELFRDGILLLLDQPATGAASAGVLGLARLALQLQSHELAARLLELARWMLAAGSPIPPYLVAFDLAELQAVIDDAHRPAGLATDSSFTQLSDAISTVTQSVHELLVAQTPPMIPPVRNRKGGLSSRELEVLCLAAEDMTDLGIADALFISKRTASDHMRNVIGKLGVQSRTGAVARALREEWCS